MRVSVRTTSSVLTSQKPPRARARPRGGEESVNWAPRGLGDDGLPPAPLLLLQSEHGAARHQAQGTAELEVLQTQFEHATTKNSDSALLEVESV